MHRTTQTPNLHFELFNLVNPDDPYLTRVHQRLWRTIRSISDTINAIPSGLLQHVQVTFPGN